MNDLTRLFLDVTANDGWNLVAVMTYVAMLGLILLSFVERYKNRR